MRVCVIGGAGYVGLITSLGFAELGHTVIGVDVDGPRIRLLQSGKSPIHEEGIDPVLKRNLDSGRIRFTTDDDKAIPSSDIVFIAVGTPSQEDGQADISQIIKATERLADQIEPYTVIVVKSTVPLGTIELVKDMLCQKNVEGKDFDIVVNPEFLREGKALYDFFYPDRIVVGTHSEKAKGIIHELYCPIVSGQFEWQQGDAKPRSLEAVPIVDTDLASAQMVKYASNAFLATRISFINEIAGLCGKVGADVTEVGRGMGYDPRIGHSYLEAGLGFGGPCLEKDLRALMTLAEGNGHEPQLLRAVLERNEKQVVEVITKLKHQVGQFLYQKTVAVLGLAFKAGTNDVRNSLSFKVIDRLQQEGALVKAHDPVANSEARELRPEISYYDDPYQAVHGADALLILTDWPRFRDLDFGIIMAKMSGKNIVDARNLLDVKAVKSLGFTYTGIGRS